MDTVRATRYYMSTSGAVHLAQSEVAGGHVLVCSTKNKQLRHTRYGGFPPVAALEEQWTVDALEGQVNRKKRTRDHGQPKMVCLTCFPPDPMVVGVV